MVGYGQRRRDERAAALPRRWLEELALPWLTFLERAGAGEGKERRALFENVVDLDFIPFSTDAAQAVTKHG